VQELADEGCVIRLPVGSLFYLFIFINNGYLGDHEMKATGVILAGGRSSRMKFNKAFAQVGGKSVIKIIIEKFEPFFDETIIVSNDPELYEQFELPIYKDIFPRMGPVSGIHSGLVHARYDSAFILGCDIPFVNMQLVEYMLGCQQDYDSVVPEIDSYLQPLSAVYSRKCIPILSACLETNRVKLIRIFEELQAKILPREILEKYGIVEEMFLNVNDIEALSQAIKIAGRN
jgi:molybdenum cofactor guanylyltransferase